MDITRLTTTSRSFVRLPGIQVLNIFLSQQAFGKRERQTRCLGGKADYYQMMHSIRILSEAMWRLFWEAFDIWVADKDIEYLISSTETILKAVIENKIDSTKQLLKIQDFSLQLPAFHGKC